MIGWIGAALVVGFVVLGLAGPSIAPYGPRQLSAPKQERPSDRHVLGTNKVGQDLLSQVLAGARSSLLVATLAAVGAVVIATIVGLAAGLAGGWLDVVLMRLADVTIAVPRLPLLMLLGAVVGTSLPRVAMVIAVVFWPGAARVLRSQVQSLRRRSHVLAARGFGAGPFRVARLHLLPEMALVIATVFLSAASRAVLLEAGLAFLGVGDPSRVSWGSIIRDARASPGLFYTTYWTWWILPPVLAIVLVLLGLMFLGMAFETRVNPRLSRHGALHR
ncbi:MAG: ABC transporter permease [Acidimicrobiales bacterium]